MLPGNVFATCGSSKLTCNTGWICIDGGNFNLKADPPTTSTISYGPSRRTSNLRDGRLVTTCLQRSQTFYLGTKFGAVQRRRFAQISMALRALRSSL